jgi:hypothetical protein
MPISLYQVSVPVMTHFLGALRAVLVKAETQAATMKVEPAVLLQARLYPNMFPLVRQVQITTDTAKGAAARLAGLEVPSFPDTETTFPEVLARIDRTLAFLATVKPAQVDGQEERTIELKLGGQVRTFKGLPYLLEFVLPNFYFHATTAYAILRHNGIELGKSDFLGRS